MAAGTVRVKGLKETQRAFRRIDKALAKEMRDGLRKAADPVRQEAADLFSRINARSAAGYRVVVRQRGVAVEQRYGRTTGQHPSFGILQLGIALEPALERKHDAVIEGVEDVLDSLANRNGF